MDKLKSFFKRFSVLITVVSILLIISGILFYFQNEISAWEKGLWTAKDFMNLPSWVPFSIVGIIAIPLSVYGLRELIKNRKAKKEEEIRIKKQKDEDEEKKAVASARLRSVIEKTETIAKAITPSWLDIQFVEDYYEGGLITAFMYQNILHKVPIAIISELVEISEIKKRLFWSGQITNALDLLNSIAKRSKDDKILTSTIAQLSIFNSFLEEHKDYKGYDRLKKEINERCKLILELTESSGILK